jgi:tRNA-Thr(GGU) m(6)t(6)A37 methyltransferase TsaA
MRVKSIGIIRSPFKSKEDTPIQPFRSKAKGKIEVFKEYQEGLRDIEGFSHIIILYEFHKSKGYSLKVRPYMDMKLRGLFATRAPRRPNQIGISVVKLLNRKQNILTVENIDIIDGTPLLDIKPYVPEFSAREKVKIGWLKGKIKK